MQCLFSPGFIMHIVQQKSKECNSAMWVNPE